MRKMTMPSIQGMLFYWMLRLSKRRNALLKNDLSIQQQRLLVEEQGLRFSTLPDHVELHPIEIGDLKAEWLHPSNAGTDQAILFLHGGAFTMGSIASSRGFAAMIAAAA